MALDAEIVRCLFCMRFLLWVRQGGIGKTRSRCDGKKVDTAIFCSVGSADDGTACDLTGRHF